jgi:hypothetical protein
VPCHSEMEGWLGGLSLGRSLGPPSIRGPIKRDYIEFTLLNGELILERHHSELVGSTGYLPV